MMSADEAMGVVCIAALAAMTVLMVAISSYKSECADECDAAGYEYHRASVHGCECAAEVVTVMEPCR